MSRGMIYQVSATPTISAASIYASGDAVGGLMTFSNALIPYSKSGLLQSIVISDLAKQSGALSLILFKANPSATTFTDNAALDIDDSDIAKVIGAIPIAAADYVALNDSAFATVRNVGLGLSVDSEVSTLYGALITTGTPTYAAVSDLTVNLFIRQD